MHPPADNFEAAFPRHEINVIAEIKYASPSRGKILDPALISPVDVAGEYVAGGAKALSILTEPKYFMGAYENVMAARGANPGIPILMKDFFFKPYQVHFARHIGASVVLLVVRYLDQARLKDLHDLAKELGLGVLVEIHNADELESALKLNCRVIGVNNRNLDTLKVDLKTARELCEAIPEGVIKICESGISERSEIDAFRALGYEGFLVGTSLMKNGQPGAAIRQLLAPDRTPRGL